MRWFGSGLNMTGSLVLAVDALVGDDSLERRDRLERNVEQRARVRFAASGDERIDIDLAPSPTCSRSSTTTDAPALASCRAAASPV
jgi:hypothetical protein